MENQNPDTNLYQDIIIDKPIVKWDDVIGLQEAKTALKENLILPIKFP